MYKIYSDFSKDTIEKYNSYLNEIGEYSLLQTIDWSILKSNWKPFLITVEENNKIKASAFILSKKLPLIKKSFLYSPRGPIFSNEKYLKELVIAIKELAKIEKAFVFKADPLADISQKELFSNYFNVKSEYKNFDGIQPKYISLLNLTTFNNEEDIINSFSSKTRYNINLAKRKGVIIEQAASLDDIKQFYELLKITSQRDNFKIRSFDYFKKLLIDLNKNKNNSLLYIAKYNNKIISGAIIIKHGETIEYLYGASSNENRNVMPNYLLQWEMIKYAYRNNFKNYSFGGISGDISNPQNPLFGLYKFKKGFNTKIIEYIGEISITFNHIIYMLFNIAKKIM